MLHLGLVQTFSRLLLLDFRHCFDLSRRAIFAQGLRFDHEFLFAGFAFGAEDLGVVGGRTDACVGGGLGLLLFAVVGVGG